MWLFKNAIKCFSFNLCVLFFQVVITKCWDINLHLIVGHKYLLNRMFKDFCWFRGHQEKITETLRLLLIHESLGIFAIWTLTLFSWSLSEDQVCPLEAKTVVLLLKVCILDFMIVYLKYVCAYTLISLCKLIFCDIFLP